MRIASLFLSPVVAALALHAQAQDVRRINSLVVVPNFVIVNTPTVVTVTASVEPNLSLIREGVTLNEVGPDGKLIGTIGRMYDDGTNGDVIPGDFVFTRQVLVTRSAPTTVWYRATAAYRGAILRIQSPVASVSVIPPSCAGPPFPNHFTFGPDPGVGVVQITAPAACAWNASADVPWILIPPGGGSGTGSGNIPFAVQPNPLLTARKGNINIGQWQVMVTQNGPTCNYSLAPTSANPPASGGPGTVQVNVYSTCPWSASSDVPWISFPWGASGTGFGTLNYRVDANPLSTPRTGKITIANQTFLVMQAGAAAGPTCAVSSTLPMVRSTGLTELTGDLLIACLNLPQSGTTEDVLVTLNTSFTSRLDATDPAGQRTEALLLLNASATPVVGVTAFQGLVAGPSAIRFPSVPLIPLPDGTTTMRIVNVRCVPLAGLPVMTSVAFDGPLPIPAPGSAATAFAADPAAASISVAPPVGNLTTVTILVRELFATAFRTRTGAALASDPAAEAGYWGPSLPSSIGVADSGTRIRAVLAVPPGVNVYAPVHPIGSQNAQLVSADANGAGGMAMTGSAFGGTYVLLTPSNGAVTATWEVRTADPTSIEQYSFPMLIEGATPGQVASMLQTVTLAPVSGVMSPSSAAPIPRFQGVALPPAP